MRESVFFEVRLRRFGVWRVAVGLVAALAIAVDAAWSVAMFDSQSASGRALVVGVAVLLGVATIAVALSLARVDAGVLACRDGVWTFAADGGAVRAGALAVAIDLGPFLLLRLGDHLRTSVWLPVQRRGLDREWHALRCAAYSPPPAVAGTPSAASLSAE
jgi:hypothetical protein